jgi:hypothetical protein
MFVAISVVAQLASVVVATGQLLREAFGDVLVLGGVLGARVVLEGVLEAWGIEVLGESRRVQYSVAQLDSVGLLNPRSWVRVPLCWSLDVGGDFSRGAACVGCSRDGRVAWRSFRYRSSTVVLGDEGIEFFGEVRTGIR